MMPRVPHPNVVRFDVRVGVFDGGGHKVKIPTLPNLREGWGTPNFC